ncbi:hypothetical protein L2E82_36197 [Cichorium intybus]|uniref:Uncharacterized protein n=1 Tax=Cichorium intybus TaxID=13427 RepID=A0ACB9BR03_CICIN|nr:hypothetical protein L2E82_36197 [Cichorium intybus]
MYHTREKAPPTLTYNTATLDPSSDIVYCLLSVVLSLVLIQPSTVIRFGGVEQSTDVATANEIGGKHVCAIENVLHFDVIVVKEDGEAFRIKDGNNFGIGGDKWS